jgi:hypothetical protein
VGRWHLAVETSKNKGSKNGGSVGLVAEIGVTVSNRRTSLAYVI